MTGPREETRTHAETFVSTRSVARNPQHGSAVGQELIHGDDDSPIAPSLSSGGLHTHIVPRRSNDGERFVVIFRTGSSGTETPGLFPLGRAA